MGRLMNRPGVLDLAKRLMGENPDVMKSPENYLFHLADTDKIAEEVVINATSRYPGLNAHLNSEEIALAGGLHDIGRPLKENQTFHELRGAKLVEERGLELGIATSQVDLYRIAQMFRSHYVVAEQFADDDNSEERREFDTLDPMLLVPRTWQEAIVIYSELSNINGGQINFKDRIEDIQARYSDQKWSKTNPSLVRAMETGLPRVLRVCERVQALREGTLSEGEIARYGFL